jgi:hypothetical protein
MFSVTLSRWPGAQTPTVAFSRYSVRGEMETKRPQHVPRTYLRAWAKDIGDISARLHPLRPARHLRGAEVLLIMLSCMYAGNEHQPFHNRALTQPLSRPRSGVASRLLRELHALKEVQFRVIVRILGLQIANGPRGVDLAIAGRRVDRGGVGVGAHWHSSLHLATWAGVSGHGGRCGGDRDRGSPRRQQRGEVAEFHSHDGNPVIVVNKSGHISRVITQRTRAILADTDS